MGLFSKKYDREKDFLRLEFDLDSKQYVFYFHKDPVQYNLLNRKTKKYLDEQNKVLNNDEKLMASRIKMAKDSERFAFLRSIGFTCDSFQALTENKGTMSKQMDEYLTKLTSEENVLLGIHRVGNLPQDKINDILINGLIITGHLGGAADCPKQLKQNVSYYADNTVIIKELMYADAYKDSIGSILIKIPDDDLTQNIFVTDNDGITRLNPKYILGYVPLEENHHIETIVRPSDLVKPKEEVNSSDVNVDELFDQLYSEQEIVEETPKTR